MCAWCSHTSDIPLELLSPDLPVSLSPDLPGISILVSSVSHTFLLSLGSHSVLDLVILLCPDLLGGSQSVVVSSG